MKRVLILSLLTLGIAALAQAQATRTWVSGVGDDVNPCSRTAPCKTFAGAISKTASPGIINCLDPGGFGAVTITKAITIDCTGTLGSVLSSGVQGVVVNALTTQNVVLRNIDINGAGTTLGTNGVNVIQAKSVHLYGVYIANYSGQGVQTTNTSNVISLALTNCQINNVGVGVKAASTSTGTTLLTVSESEVSNNANGIDVAAASSSAQVFNSVISKNTGFGFQVEPGSSGALLESDSISFNGTGVIAGTTGSPTVRISRCAIHANFTNGLSGPGTTKCFSNNVIDGNIGSNVCSLPAQPQQ
ncbi:MAG TPA: right-handed parallel beta-helix repeat-containing protein [Thermoanaerobaculia bacterium]|nr:right-handed parallel beta-helix repeat-containing protein [Thermoanaerobaculia bacterium]